MLQRAIDNNLLCFLLLVNGRLENKFCSCDTQLLMYDNGSLGNILRKGINVESVTKMNGVQIVNLSVIIRTSLLFLLQTSR